jgi:nucleoside-diphosphate-sugar epimerase
MAKSKTILVTGANGFVGQACCSALASAGFNVIGTVRNNDPECRRTTASLIHYVALGDIGRDLDVGAWIKVMRRVDIVIHLAARVHVLKETTLDTMDAFRRTNVVGTERLASLAARHGIHRFIFLSTIKVNGERTDGSPFTESDAPAPQDQYAISKWEAEQALLRVAQTSGMEVVILRPPLVYGPTVRGNMLRLFRCVHQGIPLPLAHIENRRSLVGLGNLVDLLKRCVEHPAAAGQTFLVSDDEYVSTPELIHSIASALRRPARLFPIPSRLLHLILSVLGNSYEADRLCSSLMVNSQKVRHVLTWKPPFSLSQGLQGTADWFLYFGHHFHPPKGQHPQT